MPGYSFIRTLQAPAVNIYSSADAFYCSTFPPECFLNEGASYPLIVAIAILIRKMTFWHTWSMGLLIRMRFDFC